MIGLLDVMDLHGEALEYDLMRWGLRARWLGTDRLTWRDLYVFVTGSLRDASTALHRALNPRHEQNLELDLLRSVEYSLRWLRWAKTSDGAKNRNVPEPWLFEWEKPVNEYGGDPMTVEEMNDFLGWTDELKRG